MASRGLGAAIATIGDAHPATGESVQVRPCATVSLAIMGVVRMKWNSFHLTAADGKIKRRCPVNMEVWPVAGTCGLLPGPRRSPLRTLFHGGMPLPAPPRCAAPNCCSLYVLKMRCRNSSPQFRPQHQLSDWPDCRLEIHCCSDGYAGCLRCNAATEPLPRRCNTWTVIACYIPF
jgi:hypothetical protein